MSMPIEVTIHDVINATFQGADELVEWCDDIYNENILPHFKEVNEFYSKIEKSEWHPISDDDLEMILTTLPLKLYEVTEAIHRLRVHHSIMKFNAKRGHVFTNDDNPVEDKVATQAMQVVADAYESIITRAERETSFCRELIMSAKKIWDARKRSEAAMPVGEVVPENKLRGYKAGSNHGNV